MTKPTHTHRTQGGRFAVVAEAPGVGDLHGQAVVIYHDMDRDVQTAITADKWKKDWRAAEKDDCPVCLGTGTDQIKGNKSKPCGGCFGLGKVRVDGETPTDLWELATVATAIIQRQARIIASRDQVLAFPEVKEALAIRKRQQHERMTDSIASSEQKWRDEKGHGPGGRRHTGD